MVITEVQNKLLTVFSRAQGLPREFQEISLASSFEERIPLYEAIVSDFKGYISFAEALNREVDSNLESNLRPTEKVKYVGDLGLFVRQAISRYEVLEYTELNEGVLSNFKALFGVSPDKDISDKDKTPLTENEKKLISKVFEETKVCCYEIIQVVADIKLKINPFIVEHGISYPPKQIRTTITSSAQASQQTDTASNVFKNLPPKILLLDKLGFFQLPEVERLTFESKGKLVSAICGGNPDNAVDYIRNCHSERLALGNNPYRNHNNVKAVQDLLDSLK